MSISFRVSFKSEISIQVYKIPNRHFIPDREFNPEKTERNELDQSIRNELQLNPDLYYINKYNSIRYDLNRNGMSSVRTETQSGFM